MEETTKQNKKKKKIVVNTDDSKKKERHIVTWTPEVSSLLSLYIDQSLFLIVFCN